MDRLILSISETQTLYRSRLEKRVSTNSRVQAGWPWLTLYRFCVVAQA
jgi:hypothetical protein